MYVGQEFKHVPNIKFVVLRSVYDIQTYLNTTYEANLNIVETRPEKNPNSPTFRDWFYKK